MEKLDNVTYLTHPLIQHKISILRMKETGTDEFRQLVEEIAMLEGYEALKDLPLEDVEVVGADVHLHLYGIVGLGVEGELHLCAVLLEISALFLAGVALESGVGEVVGGDEHA